ncbi:tyrosine-type recombinase/integrase [Rhizobium sp.]
MAEATDKAVQTKAEYVVWDSRVQGFGLRARPSGNAAFFFMYRANGKLKRVTIKANGPDNAYELAKALAAKHYGGGDPAAEKAQAKAEAAKADAVKTVAEVLAEFIKQKAKVELKPKTYNEYERIVDKLLVPHIGKTKVDDLTPQAVKTMQQTLNKEQEQRRIAREKKSKRVRPAGAKPQTGISTQSAGAIRVLSSAMTWAEEVGLRTPGPNPARIKLKGTRRRTRLFSDNEVSRLHAALDELEKQGSIQSSAALAIRLLFATGCRAGEICSLRWENVDLDNEIMRWPDTKTGYLEKPITDEARELLEKANRLVGNPWVCPPSGEEQLKDKKQLRVDVLGGSFERVMAKAEVVAEENASLHLIRHWFATKTYTDTSIALPIQMAIVGHGSVATAMRYAHTDRSEVNKAAREAAVRRKQGVEAAAKKGQVVPIRREAE